MLRLLSAGLNRLIKDKVFWVLLIATFVLSGAFMLYSCWDATRMISNQFASPGDYSLDLFYFRLAPFIALLQAIFISLFIGTEYSEGTLRNKIIVGLTRAQIYLSNYLVCLFVSLFFVAAWFCGGLLGIPFVGGFQMGAADLLPCLLIIVFFVAAWTSIITTLCMLLSNKALAAVLALALVLGLVVASSLTYNALAESEMTSGILITQAGMEMIDPEPNPRYISGPLRSVLEFTLDVLPSGQSFLVLYLEISRPILMLASSAVVSLATILAGIQIFRRKNLN